MSDNINFSGSVERFLKGDADPINLFGLNPNRAELRANAADRGRRATQIEFEQKSKGLRKAGGSTDPATKQVRKLSANERTGNVSLTPFNPFAFSPTITTVNAVTAEGVKSKRRKESRGSLQRSNKKHADTALTVDNLTKRPVSAHDEVRFSDSRFRRSILGRRL